MNVRSFMNWKGLGILFSVAAALLIYSTDLFKLAYRAAGWEAFGDVPVAVGRVQYFVADTPDIIGYTEPDSGERVSCAVTVAYVETEAGKTHRCCDTGKKISCLAGDFTREIPPADDECLRGLSAMFGVPDSLANVKDYQVFANCSSGASSLTAVQIDNNGRILWKSFEGEQIGFTESVLKCVLGPLLLLLAGWIVFATMRGQPREPIRRF